MEPGVPTPVIHPLMPMGPVQYGTTEREGNKITCADTQMPAFSRGTGGKGTEDWI